MTNADAIAELRAYESAVKRHHRWRDRFVDRIDARLKSKLDAEEAKLSPRARRIRDAANEPDVDCPECGYPDGGPHPCQPHVDLPERIAIAPSLLEPPPPLPPGALIEGKRVRQ